MPKKPLSICIFLLLIGSVCSAYLGKTDRTENSEYPGKCWSNDTNNEYSPGESFTLLLRCVKYVCTDEMHFDKYGCDKLNALEDGFHLESDLLLDYPDCCPIVVRNKEN